jgi:hypothetical protein
MTRLTRTIQGLAQWWGRRKPPPFPSGPQVLLPEEVEELRRMSLEMHYGDEPLYYSDPPEWPDEMECR